MQFTSKFFLNQINKFNFFFLVFAWFGISLFPNIFYAQVISQFTWDDPTATVAQADVGPDFLTTSTSSTISSGGAGGTNGLNAGLPKQDLNFRLPNSPIFDVKGIDISFDFQRDESAGTFLRRGSSLIIGGTSQLSVTYRVNDGLGGFTTVTSGNVYNIPNDDIFRTYRFFYLPSTGVGIIMVDGVVQWTNDGPDNRDMYWVGAGNIHFGDQIDGSGNNRALFDNLVIGAVINSALPVELINFEALNTNNTKVELKWETASEINNDFFTVEKSIDVENWEEVTTLKGAGNSSNPIVYSTIDNYPYSGISYYRLKQTDFDGNYTYSKIEKVEIIIGEKKSLKVFPNPSNSVITIQGDELYSLKIYNSIGQIMPLDFIENKNSFNEINYNVSELKKGTYYIRTNTNFVLFIKSD